MAVAAQVAQTNIGTGGGRLTEEDAHAQMELRELTSIDGDSDSVHPAPAPSAVVLPPIRGSVNGSDVQGSVSGVADISFPPTSLTRNRSHAAGDLSSVKEDDVQKRLARAAYTVAAFAGSSVLVWIIHNEILWSQGFVSSVGTLVLKVLVTILTIGLLASIVAFHRLGHVLDKVKNHIPSTAVLWSSGRMVTCTCELLVCAVHIPPGFGAETPLANTLFSVAIAARLYSFVRVVALHNPLNSKGGRFVLAISKIPMNSLFIFKATLEKHPLVSIVSLFGVFLVTVGYLFLIAERFTTGKNTDINLADAMYWVIITMTSVGYGDITPTTWVGRVASIVSAFVGVSLTALFIAMIIRQLQLTEVESKVVHFLWTQEQRKKTRDAAARAIQAFCKLTLARQKFAAELTAVGSSAPQSTGIWNQKEKSVRVSVDDGTLPQTSSAPRRHREPFRLSIQERNLYRVLNVWRAAKHESSSGGIPSLELQLLRLYDMIQERMSQVVGHVAALGPGPSAEVPVETAPEIQRKDSLEMPGSVPGPSTQPLDRGGNQQADIVNGVENALRQHREIMMIQFQKLDERIARLEGQKPA